MRHEGTDVDALIAAEESRPKGLRHDLEAAPKPPFQVVEMTDVRLRTSDLRDWTPVADALLAGNLLFMAEADLSSENIRYLRNRFRRQKLDVRLHVQRETRDGVRGRLLWTEQ